MSNSVARKIKRGSRRGTLMQLSRDSLIVFSAGVAKRNTAKAQQLLEWGTAQGNESLSAYARALIADNEWASRYRTKRERKQSS